MSEAAQALRLFETGGPPAGQGASIVRIGPRADPTSPQDNAFASLIAPDPGDAGETPTPAAPEGPPSGKPFAGLGTGLSGTGLAPVPPSSISDGAPGAPASDAAQAALVPDIGGESEVPAGQPAAREPGAAPSSQPAPAGEAGTADTPPAPSGTAGTETAGKVDTGETATGRTAPARPPTDDASLTPGKTDTSDASSGDDGNGEDADAAALDTAGDPAATEAASISAGEPAPAPQPPAPAQAGASAEPLAPAGPARPGAPAEPLRPVGPRSSPVPAGDGAAGARPAMGEAAQPATPAGNGNADASAGDGDGEADGDGVRAPARPVLASGADGARAFARMLGNEIGERPGPRPALPQTMAEQPVFASPHGTAQAVVRAALQPSGGVHLPVRTIAVHMAQRLADGNHEFRIRLDPPELGRVDVRMQIGRDGQLTAHLSADRPDTLDALQRDARALERALQTAGLDVEDGALSFELREHAGQGNGGAAGEHGHNEEATGEETGEDDAVRRIVSLNALDIRV